MATQLLNLGTGYTLINKRKSYLFLLVNKMCEPPFSSPQHVLNESIVGVTWSTNQNINIPYAVKC